MDTLFGHVHDATKRTLEANGYRVVEVAGSGLLRGAARACGRSGGARALAAANVEALWRTGRLRRGEQRRLRRAAQGLRPPAGYRGSRPAGRKVRDVSELLAERGPRPGAPLRPGRGLRCALPSAARPAGTRGSARPARARSPDFAFGCCRVPTAAAAAPGSTPCSAPRWRARCSTARSPAVESGQAPPGPGGHRKSGLPDADRRRAPGGGLPIGVAHPVELLDLSYSTAGFYLSMRRQRSARNVAEVGLPLSFLLLTFHPVIPSP